jgi:single-stranded DNA-binding protein
MAEINTVCISGVLTRDVENHSRQGLQVARFFIDVEGAGDGRLCGNFKVVAFGRLAEAATKELEKGSRVLVMGPLLERRRRSGREVEIRVNRMLTLPEDTPARQEPEVEPVDDAEDAEIEEDETEE